MKTPLDYSSDGIRFDFEKEPSSSSSDSRDLIQIDVDRVGSGYRMILNGVCEFELPDGLATMADAQKVAVEMAIRELNRAIGDLLKNSASGTNRLPG